MTNAVWFLFGFFSVTVSGNVLILFVLGSNASNAKSNLWPNNDDEKDSICPKKRGCQKTLS